MVTTQQRPRRRIGSAIGRAIVLILALLAAAAVAAQSDGDGSRTQAQRDEPQFTFEVRRELIVQLSPGRLSLEGQVIRPEQVGERLMRLVDVYTNSQPLYGPEIIEGSTTHEGARHEGRRHFEDAGHRLRFGDVVIVKRLPDQQHFAWVVSSTPEEFRVQTQSDTALVIISASTPAGG